MRRPVRISSISAWKACLSSSPPSGPGAASTPEPVVILLITSSFRAMSSGGWLVGRGLSSSRNNTEWCAPRASQRRSPSTLTASARLSYIQR